MTASSQENFLNNFGHITPTERRIWKLLQWYHQKNRYVYLSHAKIAEHVKCNRRTVIRAMKRFVGLGWLAIKNAAWRTCSYFMDKALIWLDLKNPKTLAPKPPKECHTECHSKCHTTYSSSSTSNTPYIPQSLLNRFLAWIERGGANAHKEEKVSEKTINHYIQEFQKIPYLHEFSDKCISKWLRRVGEEFFYVALQELSDIMNAQPTRIRSPKGWLIAKWTR